VSKGLTLWPNAGPNTRALFIRLACDGDLMRYPEQGGMRHKLTVAQALEVTR